MEKVYLFFVEIIEPPIEIRAFRMRYFNRWFYFEGFLFSFDTLQIIDGNGKK